VHYKKRSIEDGYHNFSIYSMPIDLDFYDDSLRHYYVDLDILHLYDEFEGSKDVHSMEYGYGYTYTDTKSFAKTVFSPKVGVEFQYMSVELGSTPLGATITPFMIGKVNLHTANPKWNIYVQYGVSEIDDSMLSYIGNNDVNIDGTSQIDWGRVTKSGFEAGISYDSKKIFYALSASYYNKIEGDYVVENKEKKVVASILYRHPTPNYAYLDYSLLGVYDEYELNSDLLTYGHGGYFSPQKFYLVSTAVELADNLTTDFYWKTKLSVGYEKFRVDSSSKFPISDSVSKNLDNQIVGGYEADGVIFKVALGFGVKLDEQFDLVGSGSYEQMEAFSTIEAGLFINYSFEPKHKVNLYNFHNSHRADAALR